jgi:hypothetical protein
LCYEIFTQKKVVVLKEGSEDHYLFMSLPQGLREHIIKLKKVEIVLVQKEEEEGEEEGEEKEVEKK